MGRVKVAIAIALVAVLAVLAVFGGTAGAGGSFKVKLGDNFFQPDSASVASGTTVKFKWTGDKKHSVAKKSGPGGSFESDTTDARGVNFSKRFKKSGTYRLICTVHPDEMKMKLKVRG